MDEPPSSPPGSGNGDSSHPDGLPDRIGRYRILKLLGRGGMGEVFLASDPILNRRVAIKRIRPDLGLTPIQRQRLLWEARAAAGLSHPAIVNIQDMLKDDDDNDCIVMEYVDGETLATIIVERGSLQPFQAVKLAIEVASGLEAAHAAGLIHRDLKTENVILTPSGHAKILDFGLAKPIVRNEEDKTLTGERCLMGTPRCMSPEQVRLQDLDRRSDLFSLGVLLYEMLTAKAPFRGSSYVEILDQVLRHHPPRVDTVRPGIPPRLGGLVASLLEKDRADRPLSAEEVVQELAAIAAAGPPMFPSEETISDLPTGFTPAPPPSPPPQSAEAPEPTGGVPAPERRWRHWTAVLAALGVAILVIAAARLWPRNASSPLPRLRVRVQSQAKNKAERSKLAAFGVLTTSLDNLNSREGLEAVDDSQLVWAPQARTGVVDETLVTSLDEEGARWNVVLNRERPDGQPVPPKLITVQAGDFLHLWQQVTNSLPQMYPERRLGPLSPLEAQTEDIAAFLGIRQRIDNGDLSSEGDLTRLQQVMEQSPNLLDARLLTADILLANYQSTDYVDHLNRALGLVRGAKDLAPKDARRLISQFRIELEKDGPDKAEKTLNTIAQLLPPDSPRLLVLQAGLEDKKNRSQNALTSTRNAVAFSPTWRNVYSLAKFEEKMGHIQDARGHLKAILQKFPHNRWTLRRLANLELGYGDPGLSERLFQELLDPEHVGAAQVLLHHYKEAINSRQQALETEKDQAHGNLDLGEAELSLEWRGKADSHFKMALEEIEKNRTKAGLSPLASMIKAQCLAHLGNKPDAVEITRETLQQRPDDADILRYAAQVYAIVGDQASAVDIARKALRKGVAPNWFHLPAFDAMSNNPDFLKLFSHPPGAPSR